MRALLDAGQVDEACRLLHAAHADELARFVRARRKVDADDLVQDVWAAVRRTLAGFRFEATPRGWLFTIARRKLIDAWREQDGVLGLDEQLADDEALLGLASSPRSQALRAERRAAVQRALAGLDGGERELLELRYVSGLKPAEIAEVQGEKANTVAQRLVRALRRLREALLADELFASRRGA